MRGGNSGSRDSVFAEAGAATGTAAVARSARTGKNGLHAAIAAEEERKSALFRQHITNVEISEEATRAAEEAQAASIQAVADVEKAEKELEPAKRALEAAEEAAEEARAALGRIVTPLSGGIKNSFGQNPIQETADKATAAAKEAREALEQVEAKVSAAIYEANKKYALAQKLAVEAQKAVAVVMAPIKEAQRKERVSTLLRRGSQEGGNRSSALAARPQHQSSQVGRRAKPRVLPDTPRGADQVRQQGRPANFGLSIIMRERKRIGEPETVEGPTMEM